MTAKTDGPAGANHRADSKKLRNSEQDQDDTDLDVSSDDIRAFLGQFSRALKAAGDGARVAIFSLPEPARFASRGISQVAAKAVEWAHAGRHVYFHLHVHELSYGCGADRGRRDTVKAAIGLAADIDASGPGRKKSGLCPTVQDALSLVEEFEQRFAPLRAGVVIGSGYGCYPILLFNEPFIVNCEADRERLECLSRRFHHAFASIARERGWAKAVEYCDLAKVLRLPGTLNRKDPDHPKAVRVLVSNSERFSVKDVEGGLPSATHIATGTAQHQNGDNPSTDLPLWVRARLRVRQREGEGFDRLYRGEWHGAYPSHSEADLALSGKLLKITEGDRELADALFRASGLYRSKWDRKDYRERTLDRAAKDSDVHTHGQTAARLPFRVAEDGVFWTNDHGELVKLAARVEVLAETRDASGENWGRLLRWPDNEVRMHQWAMPMEMLAAEAGAVRARLLGEGLPFITTNARLRERFTEYLQTAPTNERIRCVARVGWHGDSFALPDAAIAPAGSEKVLYQTPHETAHYWNVKGTAEEWREEVGRRCGGNSRLILAASCAFAGPLLSLLGAESGGVHFHGPTSTGKSTTLAVGGSVCGGGGPLGFVQPWRATINGLEAIAEAHNDATLFLDELSQVDARDAGETAYLLGNGQGKLRMARTIGARKKLVWRLLYVSAGELTLAEHAATAGKRTRGGAEVRLLNIEADAGAGLGLFENLNAAQSADAFVRELREAALRCYGAPLRAFLEQLVQKKDVVRHFVQKAQGMFFEKSVPLGATGEVRRAAERFALIGAGGELATRWGLTGWDKNEALRVARRLFGEWLGNRSTNRPSDADAGVRTVRAFIQTQNSRFELIRDAHYDDKREIIHNRAGFMRMHESTRTPDGTREPKEYYFFTETFRREVCNGYSYAAVLKELEARGYLRRQPPDMTIKPNLPGCGRVRVYCVLASILKGDD